MRCWLDLDLGSEVMASGFLSCFMIMVTNYFEILQEEKWLGYGPSIQWAKNGEIGQSKKEILVYYIFSGSVLVKKETVQFTVMCSLHLLVFFSEYCTSTNENRPSEYYSARNLPPPLVLTRDGSGIFSFGMGWVSVSFWVFLNILIGSKCHTSIS